MTEGDLRYVPYAEFGEEFFRLAVTPERVVGAVDLLVGRPLELGPVGVGPGGLVKLRVRGAIEPARSEGLAGAEVAHRVVLPASVAFEVDLGVETHRFEARVTVPLVLRARAAAGLKVFVEVTPPTEDEIGIELQAQGIRASVLQRVAGVEAEVRRFVARYVTRELDEPYVRQARTIDVAAAIERAWQGLVSGGGETVEHLGEDLREAVDEEIEETTRESTRSSAR